MVPKLNKKFFFATAFILSAIFVLAQRVERPEDKDYKDKKQFEKFGKRRAAVGSWQINQLKTGALVVKLKTNNLLVNSLLKQGDTIHAKEKQLETAAVNLNTIRAYFYNYTFSKVYFIYSSSIDSLLKGVRKNIFLDTNLLVDPSIVMTEKFYLLAERDYAYNSTIGFVKEDSARLVKEGGYAVKEMAIVVKNKYGHQLKKPFPYLSSDRPDLKVQSNYVTVINIYGSSIPFNIGGFGSASVDYAGHHLKPSIPRHLTYDRLCLAVSNFNEALKIFYRKNISISNEKINPELIPFLY